MEYDTILYDTSQTHAEPSFFMFYSMFYLFLSCASSQDVNIEINGGNQSTQEPSEPSEPSLDSSSLDLDLNVDDCDQAPLVTWDNWAESMILTHCQGCHASVSPNRYGAPIDIHFDHKEAAYDLADRIYIRVLNTQDMPPAGGILEEDLYLLDVWLRCSVGL